LPKSSNFFSLPIFASTNISTASEVRLFITWIQLISYFLYLFLKLRHKCSILILTFFFILTLSLDRKRHKILQRAWNMGKILIWSLYQFNIYDITRPWCWIQYTRLLYWIHLFHCGIIVSCDNFLQVQVSFLIISFSISSHRTFHIWSYVSKLSLLGNLSNKSYCSTYFFSTLKGTSMST
jgi:hypothetical protein